MTVARQRPLFQSLNHSPLDTHIKTPFASGHQPSFLFPYIFNFRHLLYIIRTNPTNMATVAHQRYQSLYQSVAEGEITLESILAIPIDWQGVAVECQYKKRIAITTTMASRASTPSFDLSCGGPSVASTSSLVPVMEASSSSNIAIEPTYSPSLSLMPDDVYSATSQVVELPHEDYYLSTNELSSDDTTRPPTPDLCDYIECGDYFDFSPCDSPTLSSCSEYSSAVTPIDLNSNNDNNKEALGDSLAGKPILAQAVASMQDHNQWWATPSH
jgi:hypothetical protein